MPVRRLLVPKHYLFTVPGRIDKRRPWLSKPEKTVVGAMPFLNIPIADEDWSFSMLTLEGRPVY